MTSLASLIADLETATGPSRELDAAIQRWLNSRRIMRPGDRPPTSDQEYTPPYTASIDAALTLVPEGWRITIEDWRCEKGSGDEGGCRLERAVPTGQSIPAHGYIWARTPSLVLCIAALKAKECDAR